MPNGIIEGWKNGKVMVDLPVFNGLKMLEQLI
jgi:hypothetical protein